MGIYALLNTGVRPAIGNGLTTMGMPPRHNDILSFTRTVQENKPPSFKIHQLTRLP